MAKAEAEKKKLEEAKRVKTLPSKSSSSSSSEENSPIRSNMQNRADRVGFTAKRALPLQKELEVMTAKEVKQLGQQYLQAKTAAGVFIGR